MDSLNDHPIKGHFFENLMKLIFEAFGSGLLAMLFVSTGAGMSFMIGFYVLLVMGWEITGAHFNPVVTLAYMLRKDEKQTGKWVGLLMMAAQVAGAIGGIFMVFYCFRGQTYLSVIDSKYVVQAIISEILGSFILVLAYMTQSEKKYRLCSDDGITLLIVAGAYFTAMALSNPAGNWTTSPLNPAIALAIDTFATFDGDVSLMHWAWIFFTFSFVGSLCAVVFYEIGFKKMEESVARRDEIEHEGEEEETAGEVIQPASEAM